MKKQFACVVGAEEAMSDFASQCNLLGFAQQTIVKEPIYSGRDRPRKDVKPTGYHYFIDATSYTDLEEVKLGKHKEGMFILATNDTDYTELTTASLLEHYKSLQKVEREFRFLKSPEFLTLSIFLKKPQRIEDHDACLLVYASF